MPHLWKLRWATLRDSCLTFYQSERKLSKPILIIPLDRQTKADVDEEAGTKHQKGE